MLDGQRCRAGFAERRMKVLVRFRPLTVMRVCAINSVLLAAFFRVCGAQIPVASGVSAAAPPPKDLPQGWSFLR
jgi:hypothetical protein